MSWCNMHSNCPVQVMLMGALVLCKPFHARSSLWQNRELWTSCVISHHDRTVPLGVGHLISPRLLEEM